MVEAPIEPRVGQIYSNRMLILISAPLGRYQHKDQQEKFEPVIPLTVQEEAEAIQSDLDRAEPQIPLHLEVEIVTPDRLAEVLKAKQPPLIIHFAGHGEVLERDDAGVVLEDKVGLACPMSAGDLRDRLRTLRGAPCQLAVLNACHSQDFAQVLLDRGARHVVAVRSQDRILDKVARHFASEFYPLLMHGHSVSDAFESARDTVRRDRHLGRLVDPTTHEPAVFDETDKIRLLPEGSTRHEKQLTWEGVRRLSGEAIPPAWGHNTNLLRISPDPFVGRREDLHKIASCLRAPNEDQQAPRCVLLSGMGGMGKSVLAQAAGRWHRERDRFAKGVWEFDLRKVQDVAQVRISIAKEFRLSKAARKSNRTLASELADYEILLILDDLDALLRFESTQYDPSGLISDLIKSLLGCPRLRLILTARDPLSLTVFHRKHDVLRMEREDAEHLLKCHSGITNYSEEDMEELMAFFDGYPFPIRMAGSYTRMKDCTLSKLREQLAGRDVDALLDPSGEPETRDTRLAKTLDLSYNNLPNAAHRIFPLLALFPRGVTEEAAHYIWGEEEGVNALEMLLRFSMAEEVYDPDSNQRRFELPEPARYYARKYQSSDAMPRTAPMVLRFFYDYVERASNFLLGDNKKRALGKSMLDFEQPNLGYFLEWGFKSEDSRDGISRSARIAALLGGFWASSVDGDLSTVTSKLEQALESAVRNGDKFGQAAVHKAIGDVWMLQETDLESALSSYKKARSLFNDLHEELREAQVWRAIGDVQTKQREPDSALLSYQKAVDLFDYVCSYLEAAQTQEAAAEILESNPEEDTKTVIDGYEKSLHFYKMAEDKFGAAGIHMNLGDVYRYRSPSPSVEHAVSRYAEARKLYNEVPDWGKEGRAQEAIADIESSRKEADSVINSYKKAYSMYSNWNSPAEAARVKAKIAGVQQDSGEALHVTIGSLGDAVTLYKEAGNPRKAAETRKNIGDAHLSSDQPGSENLAAVSYEGAAKIYESEHLPADAAALFELAGDVRASGGQRGSAVRGQDYQEAESLYEAAGKPREQRRVQEKIREIE